MEDELPKISVKFNAQIEPPFQAPEEDPPLPPAPASSPCCVSAPLTQPTLSDPMSDMLPTILVGIGFAWAIGVVTGAIIFSVPSE